MGRLPGSDSGRSIDGGPPPTAGSRGPVRELGRKVVCPGCSGGEYELRLAGQAAVAMKSRARSLRSQRVSKRWLVHLLLKSAPRRVRPQPLVDRRHTFAGALRVRRCRERAPEVWPATSSNAARPAVSANEATPPFSAVSPVPTRAPTATSSRSTTRATRRRCADPAEHAPGGSAPPAAPARGSLRPSSARPP
jgi:hypothetical protein